MKKRFMSAFLAVIMLFSMLSTTAFAASSEEEALGEINIFNGGVTMSYELSCKAAVQGKNPIQDLADYHGQPLPYAGCG